MKDTDTAGKKEKKYLLIVEDDESVAEGLTDILTGYDYRVAWTVNSEKTLELMRKEKIDLLIMDVHLDGESGYALCKKIRKLWNTPIIFLTALNSEMEIVRGFQAGGDDYITKPFRMQELIMRIQALLRRSAVRKSCLRKSGDLIYDSERNMLLSEKGSLELTATELKIVKLLIDNWPQTITRDTLLFGVWDHSGSYVEENTLNVNISRLRDKLGISDGINYIETVRGIGYRWAVPIRDGETYDN